MLFYLYLILNLEVYNYTKHLERMYLNIQNCYDQLFKIYLHNH